MPPCTSFELFDDVPDAKSSRSTRPVRRPRLAASSAQPTPVMPPPTTSTSSGSSARRRNAAARSNAGGEPTEPGYRSVGKQVPEVSGDVGHLREDGVLEPR